MVKSKDMTISLDRPSGAYYAGEVVTGSLTVNVNANSSCRSLSVKLIGKSSCHWHYGSGDDRKDFDGEKLFQYGSLTLVGNYYETDIIDEAGSDAYFGRANGDGTLYIPCEEHDDMKIIVRVRDYDYGKRDDELGEILLDPTRLAANGDPKTYQLSRKGKPDKGKGTITLSARFVPMDSISPPARNEISSSSSSQRCLILNVISANGLRKADWFGKNDVYIQAYRAPAGTVALNGKSLPPPSKRTVLPVGTRTYRFAFPLRSDAPGSGELRVSDYAHIRYYIVSKVDYAGWKDPKSKHYITVIPNRPAPKPLLLAPYTSHSEPIEVFNTECCGLQCCEAGNMGVSLVLPRLAYAPGEIMDLSQCEVRNESTSKILVEIYLKQFVCLQTTSRTYSNKKEKEFYTYLFRKHLSPNVNLSSIEENLSRIKIPALLPSFFGAMGSQEAKNEAVTWTYSLTLSAEIQAGGSKIKKTVPVLICAAPPFPSAIENAKSLATIQNTQNPWSLSRHAVVGVKPCDTIPILTGAEDGGKLIPESGYEGCSSIPEVRPNSTDVVKPYKPMVLSFDTISTTIGDAPPMQEMDRTDNETPTSTSISAQAIPSAPSNKAADITLLLLDMDKVFDKREAVGKWSKENPSVVSDLSPANVAEILSKVTFSLDQAAVAREISSGMGQNLTCAHIVEAIGACPYAKSEVAKAMAPYAVDSENKENVLNLMYTFEQKDVEKYFP